MIVRSHVSGQNKAGLPWWIQTLKSQSLVAATPFIEALAEVLRIQAPTS